MRRFINTVIITVLVLFASNVCCFASTTQSNPSMADIKEHIVKYAVEMGVEPEMALSIAKVESGFNQSKRSYMGAVGVFQLIPSTARKTGYNPYNYKENIKGGIKYFAQMKKMYKTNELALAAYNAGPGNVKKYNGIPPFAETRRYVAVVLKHYTQYKVSPDETVAGFLATYKKGNEAVAEKRHKDAITIFMNNQAI